MDPPPLPASLDYPRIKILAIGNKGTGKSCLIKRYCEHRFVSKYIPTIGIDYGVKKVTFEATKLAGHRKKILAGGGGGGGKGGGASSPLPSAVRVNFWDVAGGDDGMHIRNEFYAPAQGVLLVYDVRDAASFAALDDWMDELLSYVDTSGKLLAARRGKAANAKNNGTGAGGAARGRAASTTTTTTTSNTPAGKAVGDLGEGQAPIVYVLANKADDVVTAGASSPSHGSGGARRVVTEAEGRKWAEENGCAGYYETSASSDLNVATAMEELFYDVVAKFM